MSFIKKSNAPIISLFNHKGGVSKTTTAFNLGWSIADQGKKVLIVDGDPQCNLTGTVLGFEQIEDFEEFYLKNPNANINDCLDPTFKALGTPLQPAVITGTPNQNLFLLAGKIDLAESETQISVAVSTSQAITALQNIPGSICKLLRLTAQANDIDVVLIDMSPSVGALNQCFLMGSDYFIVPTSPDYYCNQAILSLSRVLPKWNSSVQMFRNTNLANPMPASPPKFCGIISQRYRPRSGNPAYSFQRWIDIIKESVAQKLVPALQASGMTISASEFSSSGAADTPYNLCNIADFNSLIAQSQKYNRPVFALTDDQLENAGNVLDNMKTSRSNFLGTFQQLATTVRAITKVM